MQGVLHELHPVLHESQREFYVECADFHVDFLKNLC